MAARAPDRQADLLSRVQDLQARLDAAGDSPTRRVADELLSTVIEMYGEGLERIVAALYQEGEHGRRLTAEMAEDDLVASLLLIHDLHPVPLRERVLAALEHVRPYMESHGGDVELLALEDGVARLKLQGSCSDCAASAMTLELAIKQALEATAPDLAGLEVEDVAPPPAAGPSLPLVGDGPAAPALELPIIYSDSATAARERPSAPVWVQADHLDLIPPGGPSRPPSAPPSSSSRTSTGHCSRSRTAAQTAATRSRRETSTTARLPARAAGAATSCRAPDVPLTTSGFSSCRSRCCASRGT